MRSARRLLWIAAGSAVTSLGYAQVPDLVTAFDAGGRALGMGTATNATGASTSSGFYNPAGLGFMTRPEIGASARNFPESRTVVTGDLVPTGNERLDSRGESGPQGLSHLGFVMPLGAEGRRGAIGVALTNGGQMRDTRVAGPGLTEGGVGAGSYNQLLKNRTDFVTVSYGKGNFDSGFNWGVGLLYARNNTINNRTGVPSGATLYNEQSSGFGGVFGVMFAPKSSANLTFGASYQSEIKLKANGGNVLLYDRIPARLSGGVAIRKDGMRQGKDYLVVGAEVVHHFDGSDGVFFDRDPQTTLGIGAEYNYQMGGHRIPLRLGYNFVPSGGFNFGSRNVFTYGVGFRPENGDWGVDLSFGRAQRGGVDAALSVSYRFK